MAKLKAIHKSVIITTELTVKQIKKLEAIEPDALTIVNDKDEVIFAIGTGKQEVISKNGIVFTNDSSISVLAVSDKALDQEALEESFGAILLQLSRVEEQAQAALAELTVDLKDLIKIEKIN